MTAFIGEVRIFAGNYPPAGWAFCNGQILATSQHPQLFQVIGATYGGNGTTNFALPDLRGRVPIHPGQGNGLTHRALGEFGGEEVSTLDASQMPTHAHSARAAIVNGSSTDPSGHIPGRAPSAIPQYGPDGDVLLAAEAVSANGGSQPHETMQPFLTLSYIIALQGDYPPPP